MLTSLLLATVLQAEAIGGYAAGCLKNGVSLPLEGPGYQVIRTKRLRYYGHPDLIHYLQALVARMSAAADFDEWGQTDTLFHLAVADASGSRRLLAEVTSLRGDAHRFSLSVPEPRSTFDLSNDEHRTIVNAIAAGRPDRARQAVAEHVRSAVALWLGLGLVSERTQPEGGRRARAPRTDGRE